MNMSLEMVLVMRKIEKHFFRRSTPTPVDISEDTVAVLFYGTVEHALTRAADFDAALKFINRMIDHSPARAVIRSRVSVAQAAVSALERRAA